MPENDIYESDSELEQTDTSANDASEDGEQLTLSIPDDEHPHGNNTLDAYAKRQGALDASKSERHLGLEDTHIMLVAMKHHLGVLHAEGRGPWGAGGRPGNGGKRCGKRW